MTRPTHWLLALALVGGCTGDGPDDDPLDTSDTDQTNNELGPLTITNIDPVYGSTLGGPTVVIDGTGFDAFTRVRFGDTLATIQVQTETRLQVAMPPALGPGYKDVSVQRGATTFALGNVFSYWADAGGAEGVLGEVSWSRYLGDAWATPRTDAGRVALSFLRPQPYPHYRTFTQTFGECRVDFQPILPELVAPPVTALSMTGTGADFAVARDLASTFFVAEGLSASQVGPGTTVSLNRLEESTSLPPLEVVNFARVPQPFNITEPALEGADTPLVSQTISLRWQGGNPGDYVVLRIARKEVVGGVLVTRRTVTCAVDDDGSFDVPPSLWDTWTPTATIDIDVGRVLVQGDAMPHNNAKNAVAGIFWVRGRARAQ